MANSARDWAADLSSHQTSRWVDSPSKRTDAYFRSGGGFGPASQCCLPFAWNEGRHTDILGFIAKVNDHIQKGMGLKEAVHLQWPMTVKLAQGPRPPQLAEIVDRYRDHKVGSGQIKANGSSTAKHLRRPGGPCQHQRQRTSSGHGGGERIGTSMRIRRVEQSQGC